MLIKKLFIAPIQTFSFKPTSNKAVTSSPLISMAVTLTNSQTDTYAKQYRTQKHSASNQNVSVFFLSASMDTFRDAPWLNEQASKQAPKWKNKLFLSLGKLDS